MINTIKRDLQSFISYPDIESLTIKVKLRHFFKALLDVDYRVIFIYRLACFLNRKGMKKISILLYYRLKSVHALDLSLYAEIKPGLKIVHGFNIVIGPGVSVGENCVIFNSVTLGNAYPGWKKELNADKEMPSIGERTVLCPGARVIGKIVIGDDVFIGANSVVLKDIPNCETWAGIPARKISNNRFCQ